MHDFHPIEIITPKRVRLNGLWLGPKKGKTAVIWIHGLGSSLFSKLSAAELIARRGVSVLAFNNRGHDHISRIAHVGERRTRKTHFGGAAHEKFTDCVDDIQGAINFAKRQGAKRIYLVGHSTGCQKSVYWAYKRGRGVRGIFLLAPISDRSAHIHLYGRKKIEKVLKVARTLVRRGKRHTLLPQDMWPTPLDAQRFVSLNAPESSEEIFTYSQPKKNAGILKGVRIPLTVLLAEHDEFSDRSAEKLAEWFRSSLGPKTPVIVIPSVYHGFKGAEKTLANLIVKRLH